MSKKIIIDPGHGGKSWGAKSGSVVEWRGVDRFVYEKKLALDICLELKEVVKGSFDCVLTREDDSYLSLSKRVDKAVLEKGDLFVSVHLNAPPVGVDLDKARGFEIFYLKNVGLVKESLIDESKRFAKILVGNLQRNGAAIYYRSVYRGIKEAEFAVLKNPAMPAVLIELGFITNKADLVLLMDDVFRREFFNLFLRSIIDFFEKI